MKARLFALMTLMGACGAFAITDARVDEIAAWGDLAATPQGSAEIKAAAAPGLRLRAAGDGGDVHHHLLVAVTS